MGKVVIYTGQAGTGKTTSLMKLLAIEIPMRNWVDFERVLALTFMHGSRRRLELALKFIKIDFNTKYECSTIDSFSLNLLNKFRSYVEINKPIRYNESTSETFFEYFMDRNDVRKFTIKLLRFDSVKKFISNSYPFIVVDEFQDCTEDLLEIIKWLSEATTIFIAADPFQQLLDPENLDGMNWVASNSFDHKDLDSFGNRRTDNNKILTTATCLRKGILEPGKKIDLFPCPGGRGGSFPLAEYHLKANIHYNLRFGNVAIISPTANCPFVSQLIKSLAKPYTYKKAPFKTIGPYHHLMRADKIIDVHKLMENFPKDDLTKKTLMELKYSNDFIIRRCAEKLLKRLSIRNIQSIPYQDFNYLVNQVSNTYDNFYRSENSGKITFTTIHGAKNREFDNVIVLWSYKASGSILQKRKMLYNAITRARRNALVIVQHPTDKLQDLAKLELFSLIIDQE